MQRGEIDLASFPFGDVPGMQLRPVLVRTPPLGAPAEVLVAYLSSVMPSALLPSDMVLHPQPAAGQVTNLKTTSGLRIHTLATMHTTSVRRYLGKLAAVTAQEVDAKLSTRLNLSRPTSTVQPRETS